MTKSRRAAVLSLSLALVLAACGGKIPPTHYYTIDVPAAPRAGSAPFPYDIAVARFHAAEILNQDRLVYRPAPHQVDFYEYRRWADPPPDLVTQALISHLRNAGLFRSVYPLQDNPKSDYVLRGRIENLEEVNSGDEVSVHVLLTLELLDLKNHAVLWSGKGSYENPASERSVEGVVQQLNEGVRQSLEQLTRGLATYFRSKPGQK